MHHPNCERFEPVCCVLGCSSQFRVRRVGSVMSAVCPVYPR
jgi:hypothetical protein